MDSPVGTIHSRASVRGGSWPASTRRRICSRETLECVQFDIMTARSRASRNSSSAVDAKELRTQGASEREKKQMESKVLNQRSTHGFKGDRPDSPPPASGLLCQQDFRPRAHVPAKQPPAIVTPQLLRRADLQSLHAVMMERSRQSRRPRCSRP
jgi:hypothetical protein